MGHDVCQPLSEEERFIMSLIDECACTSPDIGSTALHVDPGLVNPSYWGAVPSASGINPHKDTPPNQLGSCFSGST